MEISLRIQGTYLAPHEMRNLVSGPMNIFGGKMMVPSIKVGSKPVYGEEVEAQRLS